MTIRDSGLLFGPSYIPLSSKCSMKLSQTNLSVIVGYRRQLYPMQFRKSVVVPLQRLHSSIWSSCFHYAGAERE